MPIQLDFKTMYRPWDRRVYYVYLIEHNLVHRTQNWMNKNKLDLCNICLQIVSECFLCTSISKIAHKMLVSHRKIDYSIFFGLSNSKHMGYINYSTAPSSNLWKSVQRLACWVRQWERTGTVESIWGIVAYIVALNLMSYCPTLLICCDLKAEANRAG